MHLGSDSPTPPAHLRTHPTPRRNTPATYLSLQTRQAVLIPTQQGLPRRTLRDPHELTLPHVLPGRNTELDRIREIDISAPGVSNLQRAVGADKLVVDVVDSERGVGVAGEVGDAGAGGDGGVVHGGGEADGAVGGGEEGDVDFGTGVVAGGEWGGGGEGEEGEGGGEDG